jgi:hypothetical protein|tara:strand:- start:41 stop:265 length:225 start_codon:yes stop_codon:yes gene_type:complete
MKSGEIYEVRHKWCLPFSTKDFWSDCGPVLYLGEEGFIREDGMKIINHVVLVKGKKRLLDHTFLRFLELYDESR